MNRTDDRLTDAPVIARVRELAAPIAADLGLDLYDIEQRGATLRVTLDTPPGSPGGVDLDALALATRLLSRELDHVDPVPGRYTLEVTSPGVERSLRTPAHFQREIGKTVAVRLNDVTATERRLEGVLVAATETEATLRLDDNATGELIERVIPLEQIDRARTVFVWGPAPKPGGASKSKPNKGRKTKAKATAGAKPDVGSRPSAPDATVPDSNVSDSTGEEQP
jgi:ribosome maturation factor RimP